MASIFDREAKARWPRSQRFQLSAEGQQAERQYRDMIVASREESGRGSYDTARQSWATQLHVTPEDGMYLGELSAGPRSVDELARAVESAGSTKKEVKAALERLSAAKLVEAIVAPIAP